MRNLSVIAICIFLTSNLNGQLKPRVDTAPLDINGTILEYNPTNGDFRAYLLPEATRMMTTLEIVSQDGVFSGPTCFLQPGLFDIYTPGKLFKLDPAGFTEISCEAAVQPGLTLDHLVNDLTVSGSLTGGGSLTDAVFLVPEPTSFVLLCLGLFCFQRRFRGVQ